MQWRNDCPGQELSLTLGIYEHEATAQGEPALLRLTGPNVSLIRDQVQFRSIWRRETIYK